MGNVVHFELTSGDLARKSAFLEGAFGWSATSSPFIDDYLLLDTGSGEGIDGAVMSSAYRAQSVIIWTIVPDIEKTLVDVVAAGGAQAGETATIPGRGQLCYVTDPEGVLFGIRQPEG